MPELQSLRSAVQAHTGVFSCSEISRKGSTKQVNFRHVGSAPDPSHVIPAIQGLRDFYSAFEHLLMYVDEHSEEAAYLIASPSQWLELDGHFRPWLDALEEDDLPDWIEDCIVVGEIPRSGNYLLLPASGPEAGRVFEFEHDGYEFLELGSSLPDFVLRTLDLDSARLTAIASHMRFILPDERRQWWIDEMKDSRGNVVKTEA
jgi:hypothetical protein